MNIVLKVRVYEVFLKTEDKYIIYSTDGDLSYIDIE